MGSVRSNAAMLALPCLYAVTPEDPLLTRLSARVSAALTGGVRLLQYRNKTAPAPLRRAQAAEMLRLCRACGARLIINDDLALALELKADGVHLGREDGDLQAARAALGPHKLLGVSCYADLERAAQAAAAGADYLAFGSAFASPSKPDAPRAPLEIYAQARRFALPIVAIGGITLENAPRLLAAGVDSVAVISDLFEALDVTVRARAYEKLRA